jgi:enoyl-CoA hydratase
MAGTSTLAAAVGVFAQPVPADIAVATGLPWTAMPADQLRDAVGRAITHLAADPELARALAGTVRQTVGDPAAWDQAVEIERARQMWSLTRPRKES